MGLKNKKRTTVLAEYGVAKHRLRALMAEIVPNSREQPIIENGFLHEDGVQPRNSKWSEHSIRFNGTKLLSLAKPPPADVTWWG